MMGVDFDAVLVLGKELRRDPVRARRELAARSAAASVAWRRWGAHVLTLEGVLRGQKEPGCEIVRSDLMELGVPEDRIISRPWTCSTREEVVRGVDLLSSQVRGQSLLLITSAYHVHRVRRYVTDWPGARVASPELFLRGASAEEARRITAGTPSAEVLSYEDRIERRLGLLTTVLERLPKSLAWSLEIRSGRMFRSIKGEWDPPLATEP